MKKLNSEDAPHPEAEEDIPARFQALTKSEKMFVDWDAASDKDWCRRQRSWKRHRKTRYHQSSTGRRLRASQKKLSKAIAKDAS